MSTDQGNARSDFTSASTYETLTRACTLTGLNPVDAALMRLGSNAVYLLPSESIVVRIARSMDSIDDVRKEVRVAKWLQEEDYPAVRLADIGPESPLVVDAHPVTFWKQVKTIPAKPDIADLGGLLRRLHALEVPVWLKLPDFNPLDKVEQRLLCAPSVVEAKDIRFLAKLHERLAAELATLDFQFPFGAVHGDAHPGNLLYAETGEVVVLDFEAFCFGPREWDLSLSAARRYGFDWVSDEEYARFVEVYGFDVACWGGFPILRQVRELGMTTWLMQLVETDARIEAEFRQRMSDLVTGKIPRRWRPF